METLLLKDAHKMSHTPGPRAKAVISQASQPYLSRSSRASWGGGEWLWLTLGTQALVLGTQVFTAVLITVAKMWKQPKCPRTDEWIKMW